MAWIGPSIPVPEEIVGAYGIVVRSLRGCRYGERHLHQGRFEDALRTYDRYASLMEFEPLGESITRKYVAMYRDLPSEPVKGRCPNSLVVIPVKFHETVSKSTNRSSGSIHAA